LIYFLFVNFDFFQETEGKYAWFTPHPCLRQCPWDKKKMDRKEIGYEDVKLFNVA
jgi:hypothetical protein